MYRGAMIYRQRATEGEICLEHARRREEELFWFLGGDERGKQRLERLGKQETGENAMQSVKTLEGAWWYILIRLLLKHCAFAPHGANV